MADESVQSQIEKRMGPTGDRGIAGAKGIIDVDVLLRRALNLPVTDDSAYAAAGELVKEIREARRAADEERKKITEPIKKALEVVNDAFKKMVSPLEEAEGTLGGAMGKYADVKRARRDM